MAEDLSAPRLFARMLQTQVLTWVEKKITPLVFAGPPFRLPPSVRLEAREAPLLRETGEKRSAMQTNRWPDEGLLTARYPTVIFVLEGEADFRLGVTRRMAAQNPEMDANLGCYTVSLPERACFVIPPGVPYSDASRPHWERPHPESAHSRLLWFHVLPTGASLHSCTTQGHSHTLTTSVFVRDLHLIPLIESLMDEARARLPHFEIIAGAYLQAFLLRTERGLTRAQVLSPDEKRRLFTSQVEEPPSGHTAAVERARRFIETHLNESLSLDRIAAQAYVSSPHLNRLFRAAFQMPVMQYVTAQRLEMARAMLRDTDLPIQHIGRMTGYPHAAHFSRSFSRAVGMAPGAFRRQQPAEPSLPKSSRKRKAKVQNSNSVGSSPASRRKPRQHKGETQNAK